MPEVASFRAGLPLGLAPVGTRAVALGVDITEAEDGVGIGVPLGDGVVVLVVG